MEVLATALVGERQKGHIYYRCHNQQCPEMPLKEGSILKTVASVFQTLNIDEDKLTAIRSWLSDRRRRHDLYFVEEKERVKAKLKQAQALLDELEEKVAENDSSFPFLLMYLGESNITLVSYLPSRITVILLVNLWM